MDNKSVQQTNDPTPTNISPKSGLIILLVALAVIIGLFFVIKILKPSGTDANLPADEGSVSKSKDIINENVEGLKQDIKELELLIS